jgi:hypothetical protein
MHNANTKGTYEPREEDVLSRIRQMVGDESVDVEILDFSQWTINDQVARSWQKGNVFCIGDAVHRHPPINGLGSNTCIRDAFNLAWKLVFVLRVFADAAILNTLTAERKPVGDGVVRRANTGMLVHRKLWALIGTTKDERADFNQTLQDSSKAGTSLRRMLRQTIEETDDEFNGLGIQMNQMYQHSRLTIVEMGDSPPELQDVNLLKQQVISTFPGYHLPHVWLIKDGQSQRISILDLAGNGQFVLFTGVGGQGWLDAVHRITKMGLLPLTGYGIGRGLDYLDAYWDWEKVRGVDEDGVVLVRPGHLVCWRCITMPSDPITKLQAVLEQLLGRAVVT